MFFYRKHLFLQQGIYHIFFPFSSPKTIFIQKYYNLTFFCQNLLFYFAQYFFFLTKKQKMYGYSSFFSSCLFQIQEISATISKYDLSINEKECRNGKEEKNILYQGLSKLSLKEREIIELYYFKGRTMKDIAVKLNTSYSSSLNLKSRALKKMRKLF